MDDEKRRLRDEVAELSKAVRSLREELASSRNHHNCYGCGHWHWGGYWQWQPTQGAAGVPVTWTTTCDTATAGVSTATMPATTINAAAGGNTTYLLSTNNTCTTATLQ